MATKNKPLSYYSTTTGMDAFGLGFSVDMGSLEKIAGTLSPAELRKAITTITKPMHVLMRAYAPVRTGALRRLIGHKTIINKKTATVKTVIGLKYKKTERSAYVAGIMQERGTIYMEPQPYIQPAYDETVDKIKTDMENYFLSEIRHL